MTFFKKSTLNVFDVSGGLLIFNKYVYIKNAASKSSMSIHLFTNNDLKRNILEEKNCRLVKILIIKETKERTLKFELREYKNDFQI